MDFQSLNAFLDKSQIECLNEHNDHPVQEAFKDTDTYLASADDDPQLLLKIGFTQTVKVSGIRIKAFPDGVEDGTAPKLVKIFSNNPSMGFSDAESDTPLQILELDSSHLEEGSSIPLKFVLYQKVQSLQLFFEENTGSDETRIQYIDVEGTPAESMHIKDWKPIKEGERLGYPDS